MQRPTKSNSRVQGVFVGLSISSCLAGAVYLAHSWEGNNKASLVAAQERRLIQQRNSRLQKIEELERQFRKEVLPHQQQASEMQRWLAEFKPCTGAGGEEGCDSPSGPAAGPAGIPEALQQMLKAPGGEARLETLDMGKGEKAGFNQEEGPQEDYPLAGEGEQK